MLYHILAVGDVVMEPGLRHLERHLRPLQKWKAIDFTVVNGENAAGVGLTRDQAERIYDAGADVVTLGNHAFGKSADCGFPGGRALAAAARQLHRPGPGPGLRCLRPGRRPDPGAEPDRPVRPGLGGGQPLHRGGPAAGGEDAADLHPGGLPRGGHQREAGHGLLSGRPGVSALWGTHTHVPTADERVCPKGTGYITDLGMTGSIESVLGIDPRQSVEGFLGGLPGRYRAPEGPCQAPGRPSSRWTAPPDCAPPWSGSTYGDRDDFKPAG